MDNRPMNEMLDIAMQKVKEMIDANTVVGEPIHTVDNTTLIPVSRVSIGFAGGGGNCGSAPHVGGSGIGTGFKVEPVAFVVIKNDNVNILYIAPPAQSAVERLIDIAPVLVDKITDFIQSNDQLRNL